METSNYHPFYISNQWTRIMTYQRLSHLLSFFLIALFIVFSSISLAEEAEKTTAHTDSISFAFSNVQIREVRDLARRVGWTERTLDVHFAKMNIPEPNVWQSCAKAAILGGTDRVRLAAAVLNEVVTQSSFSTDELPASAFSLLQSYDCLIALPEQPQHNEEIWGDLQRNVEHFSRILFESSPNNPSPAQEIHLQAARLYAGMVTGASSAVHTILQGNTETPSFGRMLRNGLTCEGLLLDVPLDEHIVICTDLLQAAKALQTYHPESFSNLSPLLQRTADVICELMQADGNLPVNLIDEEQKRIQLAALIERANSLFDKPAYRFLLNNLYETDARPGDALLYGALSLEAASLPLSTSLPLPQAGAAMLHGGSPALSLSVFLDTGLSARTNTLSLLSARITSHDGPLTKQASILNAPAFNTVIVDRAPQARFDSNPTFPANAFLASFIPFGNDNTYVSAYASGQFSSKKAYPGEHTATPVTTYQRILYLAPPYVLDLFRVQGGETHDYFYTANGKWKTNIEDRFEPFAAANDEYDFLKDPAARAVHADVQGDYNISFHPAAETIASERLWILDPAGSRLITGNDAEDSFLIIRRDASENVGNLYAVVHEIIKEPTAANTQVQRLPLSPAPNERDFQAIAVVVERERDFDIFLSAIRSDITYTTDYKGGKLIFTGNFGHIRFRDGVFDSLRLVGGTKLRYDAYGVDLGETMNVGVIEQIDSEAGQITVNFPYPIPSGDAMNGHALLALASDNYPALFQPLTVEHVESTDSPQAIRLRYPYNFESPDPRLSAPIRQADQILHENFAELIYLGKDQFRLTTTAPTNVMVEGAKDRNRVLFRGASLMRRIRGESVAGVILLSVDPTETIDGKVEFVRMP
ncbi:MAG: hypothetical protein C4527_14925 [Candidatus Omnitrophota bacterium]|nr:MAG: hypothetical protein C4527_14925 [Candidatus Omnitrophota bacterium]